MKHINNNYGGCAVSIVKNCESCRHRAYLERDNGAGPSVICNNIWMMCYGDEKDENDIFDCTGCVGYHEDVCVVAPKKDESMESITAIRTVADYFGMDAHHWMEHMHDPLTVSDLFIILEDMAKR